MAVGPSLVGHLPQCLLSLNSSTVGLRRRAHLAVPGKAERTDTLGQLEDLCHGEERAFPGPFVARAFNAARIVRQNLVFLGRRHEDRTQKPVRLRRRRDGYAIANQGRSPLPDGRSRELAGVLARCGAMCFLSSRRQLSADRRQSPGRSVIQVSA